MEKNNIKLRIFKDSDFSQVLSFLNKNLEFDTVSSEILKEKIYEDPYFDINNIHIAEQNNKILGFVQAVLRDINKQRYGYIKLFAVDKAYRRCGIGTKLYNQVFKYFKKEKVNIVRVYDVPLNYFMPGIDPRYTPALCFFEKLGFKKFDETCNLKVDLNNKNWDVSDKITELKEAGIQITRAEDKDKQKLSEFVADEWKLWVHEVETALKSKPKAVFIARYKGKIKAFSAYNGNNIGTAWFGPMGTHPDLRGKGIGSILLYLCLQDMKEHGFKYSTIPWVGPISFYSHYADAFVERVFWRYELKIKNTGIYE
ncbi:MAG: GNAT family N-acetyltransferase [Bacteroidales bacterium]|nr:GNAT family N-acetyltransferase [Bacteroidales bacterium]